MRSVGVGTARNVGAVTPTRGFAATSPIEGEVDCRAGPNRAARAISTKDKPATD